MRTALQVPEMMNPTHINAPAHWYFACHCNAKWFNRHKVTECPRCGCICESREQLVPPWHTSTRTHTAAAHVVLPRIEELEPELDKLLGEPKPDS